MSSSHTAKRTQISINLSKSVTKIGAQTGIRAGMVVPLSVAPPGATGDSAPSPTQVVPFSPTMVVPFSVTPFSVTP